MIYKFNNFETFYKYKMNYQRKSFKAIFRLFLTCHKFLGSFVKIMVKFLRATVNNKIEVH